MEYQVLTIGLTDELFSGIQAVLTSSKLHLTSALTLRDASFLLEKQIFQLLIVDLEYLRSIRRTDWLNGIRRISLVPIIVLSDNPEQDTHAMVRLGADICVSDKGFCPMIADLAFAQLRRFTKYNQYQTSDDGKDAPFHRGDIFIDPARRIVNVCGRSVNLRPREFSLLLYFMRNPNIVLTADQICEHAWGIEYAQPVGQSIYDLRQQIESNPNKPCYIETVYRVGYRFTAYSSGICDD